MLENRVQKSVKHFYQICFSIVISCICVNLQAADDDKSTSVSFANLPDWSGVWLRDGPNVFDPDTIDPPNGRAGQADVREHPPYNDKWEAKYINNIKLAKQDKFPDPLTFCLPPGFPRSLTLPGAVEFVVRPEQVWILNEDGPNISRIYTDGRSLPKEGDYWPTFDGESVGHWEGDTLVFKTIGLKGEGDTILDRTGAVLSDKINVATRMRLIEMDKLEAIMVINDPVALSKPWTVVRHFERQPKGTRLFTVVCNENNRNPVNKSGKTLTLDTDGKVIDILE